MNPNNQSNSPTPSTSNRPIASAPVARPPQPDLPAGFQVSATPTPPATPSPLPRNKKPFIIGLILAGLVLLGTAGFVFGYYLPNRPENVWRTGLDRTGEALEKIYEKSTVPDKLAQFGSSKISGSLNYTSDSFSVSGNLESKFDASKSNSELTIKLDTNELSFGDNGKLDLGLAAISNLAEGKRLPDLFLKISGYSQLGFGELFVPGINAYDGRWISIPSEFLESQLPKEAGGNFEVGDVTSEEWSSLARAVVDTADEYLFTSDESKGIIRQHEFIGKEDLDGVTAYHYKAAFNPDNFQKACEGLVRNVFAAQGIEKFFGGDTDATNESRDKAVENCRGSMTEDERKRISDYRFDVWIDSKYKLIHKLRFEDESIDGYLEIGQNYTGGDDVTLFIRGEAEDYSFKVEVESDLNTLQTELRANVHSLEDNSIAFTLTFKAEPYTEDISADQPEDTVPIEDIINQANQPRSQFEDTLFVPSTFTESI